MMNYRHPQLVHSESKRRMELDVYIPSLQVALEYQGRQHYKKLASFGSKSQQQRDEEKREACKELGIALIEIPYWWNNSLSNLASTLRDSVPKLVPSSKL
jgi:hypothetical protein